MTAVFSCSIDDGHPSDMKAAELLHKRGIKCTFYIPLKNREGPKVLTSSGIRQIAREFEVGAHTYDHCYLNGISSVQANYQIVQGKVKLEDILQKKITGFCYPGGKYSREHVGLIQAAGFIYARTTMNLCFETGDRAFEMPTTFQFYPHNRNVYLRNFAKGGNWRRRQDGLRLALMHRNWIDRLYALFEYSSQKNGVFHLWGHSKDIDDLGAWQEFDRFLAHVATRISPDNRLSNEQLAARRFNEINSVLPGHEHYHRT